MTTEISSKLSQRSHFPTHCANQFSSLSRKPQLEHLQCVRRLLKTVYGLVHTRKDGFYRVATDLRNMGSEESFKEPCLRTFHDEMVQFKT